MSHDPQTIQALADALKQGAAVLKKRNLTRENCLGALADPFGAPDRDPNKSRIMESALLPALGRDLYALNLGKSTDPPYVREDLLGQLLLEISGQRQRVLLVGDSGTGKNALVDALAAAIVRGGDDITGHGLQGRHVVECTPDQFASSCIYAHEFETKIQMVAMQCVKLEPILFIDQMQGIVTQGRVSEREERTLANLLMPMLQRSEIAMIGATTPAGLKFMQSQNPDFVALFNRMDVPEPSRDELRSIVAARMTELGLKDASVAGEQEDIVDCLIDLCARFIRGRKFPGKAIDMVADLCDASKQPGAGPISGDTVVNIVSHRTGLRPAVIKAEPLAMDDVVRALEAEVIEQPEAVRSAADVILRVKANTTKPDKPLGTMLLCGPTGVGKTQLARAIAAYLFPNTRSLLRYDMSEFAGLDAADKLIGERGSSGETGVLVSGLRASPASVVLFDEVEKAHPVVHNLLLQVLDDARLTSRRGETVSFDASVVLCTSNAGPRRQSAMGVRNRSQKTSMNEIYRSLEESFTREFFNRFDYIVLFNGLSPDAVNKIAEMEVARLTGLEGVSSRNITVSLSDGVRRLLSEQGYSADYGARAMQRAVSQLVTAPLSRLIAGKPDIRDCCVRLDVTENGTVTAEPTSSDAPDSVTCCRKRKQ